jgi:aconitate hydratase
VVENSFGTRSILTVDGVEHVIHRLDVLARLHPHITDWPYSVLVLLENLLRNEDGITIRAADIERMLEWDPSDTEGTPTLFRPARVLLQDFTGVPTTVDLASMRSAMAAAGGDPRLISPQLHADLVMDHSVMVDFAGVPEAARLNLEIEYARNRERYRFLRWGARAFDDFRVIPPGKGIVHQVNIEHLASVVMAKGGQAYPDTLIGLDSHTTMVNGLGVLGWGVGGIEAEAAMLGQPISLLVPPVVGLRLHGHLPNGTTATDLVLTITELLRAHGVVGQYVEFHGAGIAAVPLENRATIGNMSPEYGSTATMFPVDEETLRYLRFTGRPEPHVRLVEAYLRAQGLFHDLSVRRRYSSELELDLSMVVPSLAGPSRPQDRVPLTEARHSFRSAVEPRHARTTEPVVVRPVDGTEYRLKHGCIIIASITSCTNTSNPQVMAAAGLLAKRAVEHGLRARPWVRTSLAPGSRVVMDYLSAAGLTEPLEQLGFHLTGFGCMTCAGNSGPLAPEIVEALATADLATVAVLSGNRNFEGRIHPLARMNYLASPPLVVAYALAGTMDIDILTEPLGQDPDGRDVFLADVWPSTEEIAEVLERSVRPEMFTSRYADIEEGDDLWSALGDVPEDGTPWDPDSTYLRPAPFWDDFGWEIPPLSDIRSARVLAVLGDSVTTDHISPAGSIPVDSPAGQWLIGRGVRPEDFNSYGSRRGNHEVMMRGGFGGLRLLNLMLEGVEGGRTLKLPECQEMWIFDAAQLYRAEGVPLVVLAGSEYGAGSSRDWAAKAPHLLGVRAIIAHSFERIHRSNLVGMGILPLQFRAGDTVESVGLTGHEVFHILGLERPGPLPRTLTVHAGSTSFEVDVRLDTSLEQEYFRHGGILDFVMRDLHRASLVT